MSNILARLNAALEHQQGVHLTVPRAFLIELRSELLQASAAAAPDLDALVQKQRDWNDQVIRQWLNGAYSPAGGRPPKFKVACTECKVSMFMMDSRDGVRMWICSGCRRRAKTVGDQVPAYI